MKRVSHAMSQWLGHMRRGLQLKSERDYLAALSLIPELAEKKQPLIKTLRGLADLYAEFDKPEDAALLFERIAQEAAAPTKIFWCDYARLLFKLAEKQLREKQVAAASTSLEKVRAVAAKVPGHPEMAALSREGYLQIGLLFEAAGAWVPADLYIGRALEILPPAGAPDGLQMLSELAWRAYWRRNLDRADHWISRAEELGPHVLSPKAGHPAARIASLLAALGAAAAQDHLKSASAHYFSWAEGLLKATFPGGSNELADLLVAWASCEPAPAEARRRFEEALGLRQALLGDKHPKTRELRAALGLEGEGEFRAGFDAVADDAPSSEPRPFFPRAARPATLQEVKSLRLNLVKLAHPDQARSPEEFEARNRLMTEINAAAAGGDSAELARLAARARKELKSKGWLRS